MIEAVGLFVGSDMSFHEPRLLTVFDLHKGFLNADLPGADGLDLASLQCQTCLKFFQQEIFEACLAIRCYHFDVFSHKFILPQSNPQSKIALSPFEDGQPCKKTQRSKEQKCTHKPDRVRDRRTNQGADQD